MDQAPDKTIAYTNFDLPRQITTAAGQTRFAYDAFGSRVRKQGPGGTTLSIAGLYERRETANGTQHVFLVSGSDGPVAQVIWSEPDGKRSVQYLHQDGLGSVTLVSDRDGVVARAYYEPFGKRIGHDGESVSGPVKDLRLGLTGHDYDDELGLINMGGRMYDPALKRVLTPDPYVTLPLFGQSHNRYSYVRNDPVNVVDPTGYGDNDGPDCTACTPPPQPPAPGGDTAGGGGPVVPGMPHDSGYPEPTHPHGDSPKPPPIVKSDIDGGSSQAAASGSWRDSSIVQTLGGFAVGLGLGVVPGGGQVDQLATGAHVIDEGTQSARIGKAVGEIVGGFVITGVGMSGEAASWALNVTGVGAILGVPGAVVSAGAVTGGMGNIAAGAENLTHALSVGAGRGGEAPGAAPGPARGATPITKGEQVTEQVIREAMKGAPLQSQQGGGISLRLVQQYVDKLLAGEVAPAIKVDGQIIVDGNHRYIAGRILGQEPSIQPWAGGRGPVVPWDQIKISTEW